MQRWECKQVWVQRSITSSDANGYRYGTEWDFVVTDKYLNELGADGWELVNIVSLSNIGGEITPKALNLEGDTGYPAGYISYSGPMVAGLTTQVGFYFKRSKA